MRRTARHQADKTLLPSLAAKLRQKIVLTEETAVYFFGFLPCLLVLSIVEGIYKQLKALYYISLRVPSTREKCIQQRSSDLPTASPSHPLPPCLRTLLKNANHIDPFLLFDWYYLTKETSN